MNDDYSFYESGALAAAAAACANNWAGASHWKFVGVKKKVCTTKKGTCQSVGSQKRYFNGIAKGVSSLSG